MTRHARCDLRCVPGDALAAPGDAAPILCAGGPSLMRPLVCRIRVMLPRLPRGGLPVLARGGAAWVKRRLLRAALSRPTLTIHGLDSR